MKFIPGTGRKATFEAVLRRTQPIEPSIATIVQNVLSECVPRLAQGLLVFGPLPGVPPMPEKGIDEDLLFVCMVTNISVTLENP